MYTIDNIHTLSMRTLQTVHYCYIEHYKGLMNVFIVIHNMKVFDKYLECFD